MLMVDNFTMNDSVNCKELEVSNASQCMENSTDCKFCVLHLNTHRVLKPCEAQDIYRLVHNAREKLVKKQ